MTRNIWPVGVDMDLLANDLSVHEQFRDLAGFRDALSQLMALRGTARRFGREIQCPRTMLNTRPIPGMSMQQAIGKLDLERQRAVMSWLTRSGPFWDDGRQHGKDDWLECNGEIVTDTAIGEAACRMLHGVECGVVSLTQSAWCCSPLGVAWVREAEGIDNRNMEVENWWCAATLEGAMRSRPVPLGSWDEVREAAGKRCASLMFADDCFAPLDGMPFAKRAAGRLLELLDILDRFADAFGDDGARDAEGHRLYQDYFTGQRALFSDSSDAEKRDFRRELPFIHPEDPAPASSLCCTWHGKIPHLTLRLHFSWPVTADRPVYVVYAGPKITKR